MRLSEAQAVAENDFQSEHKHMRLSEAMSLERQTIIDTHENEMPWLWPSIKKGLEAIDENLMPKFERVEGTNYSRIVPDTEAEDKMSAFQQGVLPLGESKEKREYLAQKYPLQTMAGAITGLFAVGGVTAPIGAALTGSRALAAFPTLARVAAGKMAAAGLQFGSKELSDQMAEMTGGDKKTFNEVFSAVGAQTALGVGLGGVGTVPSPFARIPAEAAYGYVTTKISGATDLEAGINGAMFAVLGAFNAKNFGEGYIKQASAGARRGFIERLTSLGVKPEAAEAAGNRYFAYLENLYTLKNGKFKGLTVKDYDEMAARMREPYKRVVEPILPKEALPGPEATEVKGITPDESNIFKNNLNESKTGVSTQAHISDLPVNIANERKIPRAIFIDQKMIDKIEKTHLLPVDESFVDNLNTADKAIFYKDEPSKINFVKDLGNEKFLLVSTKRFNGHFVVTGFETGKPEYISSIEKRGEVVSLTERTPNPSITPPEGGLPAGLSGVDKAGTSPDKNIPQEPGKSKAGVKGALEEKIFNIEEHKSQLQDELKITQEQYNFLKGRVKRFSGDYLKEELGAFPKGFFVKEGIAPDEAIAEINNSGLGIQVNGLDELANFVVNAKERIENIQDELKNIRGEKVSHYELTILKEKLKNINAGIEQGKAERLSVQDIRTARKNVFSLLDRLPERLQERYKNQLAKSSTKEELEKIISRMVDGIENLKTVKPMLAELEPPEIDYSQWKDKPNLFFHRETPERNIEDIAPGKDAEAVKKFVTEPIKKNETDRAIFITNLRKDIREAMDKLGIRKGTDNDIAVMAYGEKRMTLSELKEKFPKDWENIKQASDYFRMLYDSILDSVNVEREKYGYSLIPKRQDYFRHYQELGTVFGNFGVVLKANDLPTEIAGLTDIFVPGKPFTNAELARLGGKFTESAIGGMDNYIDNISLQLFHTGSVQRIRTLENQIREQAADNRNVVLPGFVSWLREYGNLVSGKKGVIDRPAESILGRHIYSLFGKVKKQTYANMIGANVSSALMNFIPFTQSIATTGKVNAGKGILTAFATPFNTGEFSIDGVKSDLYSRRYPETQIQFSFMEAAGENANALFRYVDQMSVKAIIAGKYYDLKKSGIDNETAMKQASDYTARIVADRSWGQMPTLFGQKVLAPITNFQVEVNNMYSNIVKDIPKQYHGDIKKTISALATFVVLSYLVNNLYEKVMGRRPTIDPVYALGTVLGITPKGEKRKLNKRIYDAGIDLRDNLPFLGSIFGGRFPIGAGVPNIGKFLKGESSFVREAAKPLAYLNPLFGGGQIKKTVEGVAAYSKGRETTPKGKTKYRIEQSFANFMRAVFFGKYSFPEAQEYFNKPPKRGANKELKFI